MNPSLLVPVQKTLESEDPEDRFAGFFEGGPRPSIEKGGLLDTPAAHAWLELIERVSQEGRYTFQAPLQQRSGPRVRVDDRDMLMMSAYDYLGLIGHPDIEGAALRAVERYGTGTGGVRLLTGTTELHRRLEDRLAEFKGTEAAVTFSSGYMAVLGLMTALFGPRDRVLLDDRAHRSVLDACVLARVPFRRFRHNDPDALEAELARGSKSRRTLIFAEGVYSMDGDLCPLPAFVELKKRYGAFLLVDGAHSFGVLGDGGRGIDEHWGLPASEGDIWIGSLSKAIPSNGGFIAGRREMVIYLQHGAAPFMFSAALCPAAAAAVLESLAVIDREPERLIRLRRNSDYLRQGLNELGYDVGTSESPVIPVILGELDPAVRLAHELFRRGIVTAAAVPPAVAKGAARLRLCATAAHSIADLDEALGAFAELAPRLDRLPTVA